MVRRWLSGLLLLFVSSLGFAADQGGVIAVPQPLFPPNNWWNIDVSAAPLDLGSAGFITKINEDLNCTKVNGSCRVHPDFGGDAGGGDVYGFPFIRVNGSQTKLTVDFSPGWPEESDGVGVPFYPVPAEAITLNGWVEGGQPGNVDQRDDGDRHILIVDETNNHLYELFNVWYNGTNWEAASGAFFDMNTNNRRPEGWTSADAAGLAILPGLVRYDEVFGEGEIRHAFRVTIRQANGHVFPASHTAGTFAGTLPMGARLRLKSAKDISGFSAPMQKIFRALKKYGLIVADNGSPMFISGAYDTRWDAANPNSAFHALNANDFEVIQLGWKPQFTVVITPPSPAGVGDPGMMLVTLYDQNYAVATGYTGTIQFSSSDASAVLPPNYAFTGADAGTHSFPITFFTPGVQVVTATDVASATITGSRSVIVGPPAPLNLVATATTASNIQVSWSASTGAANYEVLRKGAGGGFTVMGTTGATSFPDAAVTSGAAYVYAVRALDASARPSPTSAPDLATARIFTDDPAVAATTPVKAAHVTELRDTANAVRATAGLSPATFTDALLTGVVIKAIHFQQLRSAISTARASLGLPAIPFTNEPLVAGTTPVNAAHLQELRSGAK
jgi:hypothetical protein